MNAHALELELRAQRTRTRKVTGLSLLIHAALLLLLFVHRAVVPEAVALTEISWIEPEPVVPAASPPAAERRAPVKKVMPLPRQEPEHFVRKTETSDFAPRPQKDRAVKDRLERKLTTLERSSSERPRIASLAAAGARRSTSLASVPEKTGSTGSAVALERSDRPASSPVSLVRSEKRPAASRVKLTSVPDRQVTPARVAAADSTARRMIDGMSLTGQVADRDLLRYGKPGYPDWAKVEGIEGSVDLYFIVLPDGRVKENVLVQRTSGFEDFDENAIQALLAWQFEPLDGGRTGEQWGAITFDYRLSE